MASLIFKTFKSKSLEQCCITLSGTIPGLDIWVRVRVIIYVGQLYILMMLLEMDIEMNFCIINPNHTEQCYTT